MFGDILSDQAGAVVADLDACFGQHRWAVGLYEPVHGPARHRAGKESPILSGILSAAMLLRHSFHLEREAACIESAVQATLATGHRTRDPPRPDNGLGHCGNGAPGRGTGRSEGR